MARTLTIENMPPTVTGKSTGRPMGPVAEDEDFRFHALLYPNRSLSRDGFRRVLSVVVGVNIVNAVIYLTLGAWPVAFFCGVDILIVWWAFKLSYMQGRRHERVMLTDDALWISRVLPSGHETRWKLSPYWARVSIDRPVQHDTQLQLIEKGRTLVLGSFLSPKERGELAEALGDALAKARTA
ncbi:DUF2244 domain-containing protein [Parvularcula maris]|uniref:DUF2244 domain-containing protein n=1 Tax=Parvularcula maris TaxID=2965077 RepID=A0A9X2RJV1_9PROT|nr:DUF2244 domain-containing protein [Parvularcula maris]MCQ8186301.1 DUF2244 domain-containing protein [Parvularcula maris]